MCGFIRNDWARIETIRETLQVGPLDKTIKKSRLRWLGHEKRREESYVNCRINSFEIGVKRKMGRPKKRLKDRVEEKVWERRVREGMKNTIKSYCKQGYSTVMPTESSLRKGKVKEKEEEKCICNDC